MIRLFFKGLTFLAGKTGYLSNRQFKSHSWTKTDKIDLDPDENDL